MEWQEQILDGFIDINIKSISSKKDLRNINYYDISSIGTGTKGNPKYYEIDEIPSRAKRIIEDNDVIIATVRPINRSFYYCKNTKYNDVVSTGFAVLSVKKDKMDSRFLYYIISSKKFTSYLVSQEQGATYPAITPEVIKKAKIKLPPPQTQQKIASLLSNYDKLIENNNKRIKLLESMAEELYKEWFIRLRFPGYESVEIKDGVPDGWEKSIISSFGKIVTGKTPSTKNSDNFGGDIPFIKTPDFKQGIYLIDNEETLTKKGADSQKSQYIPKNSICVSCIGTVGEIGISIKISQSNQQINSIVLNDETYLEYLYLTIKYTKPLLEMFASSGATMGNLSKSKFSNMKIVKPNFTLVEKYHLLVEPSFNEIKILQQKNQTLKQTRDLLLPRLMSGKLNIEDLDII